MFESEADEKREMPSEEGKGPGAEDAPPSKDPSPGPEPRPGQGLPTSKDSSSDRSDKGPASGLRLESILQLVCKTLQVGLTVERLMLSNAKLHN